MRAGDPLAVALPPNNGALGVTPPLVSSTSAVTAIITGDRAEALVYEGARSRIISRGDLLEGHRVTSIVSDGVHLDDGSVRGLAEGHQ